MTPLVSVLIPCYNAAQTLPIALASLLVQTYENWECVLVDDGSIDHSGVIAAAANDPRIRYFRLNRNMGRGVARQVALNNARGDLVAWLDADDWYYPEKLRIQVDVMESKRDIAVLSAGMAIVDRSNRLTGIRVRAQGTNPICSPPLRRLTMPPFAFAPSMVRIKPAQKAGFDPAFLLSQDVDFLLRILLCESHCLLSNILYVYTEFQTVSSKKVLAQCGFVRWMFWKHRTIFPYSCSSEIIKWFFKSMLYRAAFTCGLKDRLIQRRSKLPTLQDLEAFQRAQRTVAEKVRVVFAESSRVDSLNRE
jgi:glycosyltransferase involved in cell wall biosynthesis